MNLEDRNYVEKIFLEDPEKFSCWECKKITGDHDCEGCPVYVQSFSDDDL